jgi:hypothetical protein
MAKVCLRVFRAPLLSSIQVVHQGSHHSSLCTIRLGRRNSPSLEDLGSRLYLFILRYCVCYGPVFAQLGPSWSIQRRP